MTKQSKPLLTAASIGKRYIRRDNTVSGAIERRAGDENGYYPFTANDPGPLNGYTEEGFWFEESDIDPRDLIRLATPAEIAAGRALPVKERKVKEGRTHQSWCYEVCAGGRWQIQCEPTRKDARKQRDEDREIGWRVGPIFKTAITCPAWSPK